MKKIFKILLCIVTIPSNIFSMQLTGLVLDSPNQKLAEFGLYQTHIAIKSLKEAQWYINNVGATNKNLWEKIQENPCTIRTIIRNISNDYNKETIAKKIHTKGSQTYLDINAILYKKLSFSKKELSQLGIEGADFNFIPEKPLFSSLLIRSLTEPSKITTFLLENGANPNLMVNNTTALELAIHNEKPKKVKIFLMYGAIIKKHMLPTLVEQTLSNPSAKNIHKNIEIIKLLYKYGADQSSSYQLACTFQKIATTRMNILNEKIISDLQAISEDQSNDNTENNLSQLALDNYLQYESIKNKKIVALICKDNSDNDNLIAHKMVLKFKKIATTIVEIFEKNSAALNLIAKS